MKKLLILLMALVLMLSFTACGDDDDNDGGNDAGTSDNGGGNDTGNSDGNDTGSGNGGTTACTHEHVKVTKMGSPATCTNRELSAEITCEDCGKKIQEQTEGKRNYNNHGAFTHTASISPSCTAKGNTPKTQCGWCGTIVDSGEAIDALGHSWVNNDDKAPTCTSAGSVGGQHCSVCFIENPDNKATVIPALDHKDAQGGSTWVQDNAFEAVPSTCTAKGKSAKYECSQCHDVKYDETALAEHTPTDVAAKAATCVAEGNAAGKKCSVCEAVLEGCAVIPVDPTAHGTKAPVDTAGSAATCSKYACTAGGEKCTLCGVVTTPPTYDTAAGYATTHSGTEVEVVVINPTCEATGTKHFKCSECGEYIMVDDGNGGTVKKSDVIAKLDCPDADEDDICDSCGKCLNHADASDPADGKCDVCGKCVGDHVDAEPAGAVDGVCDTCGADMPAAG